MSDKRDPTAPTQLTELHRQTKTDLTQKNKK